MWSLLHFRSCSKPRSFGGYLHTWVPHWTLYPANPRLWLRIFPWMQWGIFGRSLQLHGSQWRWDWVYLPLYFWSRCTNWRMQEHQWPLQNQKLSRINQRRLQRTPNCPFEKTDHCWNHWHPTPTLLWRCVRRLRFGLEPRCSCGWTQTRCCLEDQE